MRQLYLAATGQNRGKTTAALGLLDGFVTRGLRTGFFKPVGQRTVIEDGVPADEDAVLMRETFGLRVCRPALPVDDGSCLAGIIGTCRVPCRGGPAMTSPGPPGFAETRSRGTASDSVSTR